MEVTITETTSAQTRPQVPGYSMQQLHQEEEGLATAEYGIVMLAAVGFAGLLVAVLSSDTARGLLTGIVERALSF
ncbi:DUF4244 domain-containing protein [Nesterenkonia lutea]|uniref:Flp pilus assembly pilin Flp n=1 Tax=Nesterenkonia lutea TaxID=272919 RepID=A0ABR9JHQ4_9MICC|nr:DUF4244 domain-containing protein [Nesterenkonia lutea]MBE1525451.1 Flp pilus assembly pilin Flp [Nesterenkonia lutea]